MRFACLWGPSFVLIAWAVLLWFGLETRGITIAGRILLAVTLALHIRQELHDRQHP